MQTNDELVEYPFLGTAHKVLVYAQITAIEKPVNICSIYYFNDNSYNHINL